MFAAYLRPFIIALQFLTRLPTPGLENIEDREVGRSLLYYPLVGLVLGLLLLAFAGLTSTMATSLQAALLLAFWVLLSGALHLDGLADSADAWLGGHGDRQRSLDIMKDPRCGPAAVIILVLVLLIKFTALEQLLLAGRHSSLLIIPVLARGALLLLFQTTSYAREQGLACLMAQYHDARIGNIIMLCLGLVLLAWYGWQAVVILLVVVLVFIVLRYLMLQRLGGFTGDTAGAQVELMELALCCVLVLPQ